MLVYYFLNIIITELTKNCQKYTHISSNHVHMRCLAFTGPSGLDLCDISKDQWKKYLLLSSNNSS